MSIFVLKEVLGALSSDNHASSQDIIDVNVPGGEIVTMPLELISRIEMEWHDIATPNPILICGIRSLSNVVLVVCKYDREVIVNC